MRHNRILRRLLSCRRARFSCEQVGLKRIYGKPTSPDKAVKYGTPPCNCRSDHQLARDVSPSNDRWRVPIAAARTSAAIIEICAFRCVIQYQTRLGTDWTWYSYRRDAMRHVARSHRRRTRHSRHRSGRLTPDPGSRNLTLAGHPVDRAPEVLWWFVGYSLRCWFWGAFWASFSRPLLVPPPAPRPKIAALRHVKRVGVHSFTNPLSAYRRPAVASCARR
jgi:hypothetical protein